MTDPELQEFAGLWQEPDPPELARFEELARRARRQGRLLGYADIALTLLLVAPLVTVFMKPHPVMIAVAVPLLIATVWLFWARRRLRQMTATLNTSDPAAFLESSVGNATANLRQVTLTIMLMPVFATVAVLFKGSQRSGGRFDHLIEGVWTWASSARGLIALAAVVLLFAAFVRSRKRLREELRRLERLRLDYEEERRRDEEL